MNISQPVPEWVLTIGGWIGDRAIGLTLIVGLPVIVAWVALALALFQYARHSHKGANSC